MVFALIIYIAYPMVNLFSGHTFRRLFSLYEFILIKKNNRPYIQCLYSVSLVGRTLLLLVDIELKELIFIIFGFNLIHITLCSVFLTPKWSKMTDRTCAFKKQMNV